MAATPRSADRATARPAQIPEPPRPPIRRDLVLGAVAFALLLAIGLDRGLYDTLLLMIALAVASAAVLVWRLDPAYTLSAAFVLSPFAGNWSYMHFPSGADPNRILLVIGIAQVLIRTRAVADRPRLRFIPAHAVLALAVLYVMVSAFAAGTLFAKGPLFRLIDTFGVLPFLAFLVAPLAFQTERHRSILMVAIMILGAYLGLTTIFEGIHLNALVFPRYILNPNLGIHVLRGRGPFLDAVANGFALFVCAMVCGLVASTRPRLRWPARTIAILCVVGIVLCLERSVWIGSSLGLLVALLVTPSLRRYALPAASVVLTAVVVAFAVIPGLETTATGRISDPTWDRQNLDVAGLRMIAARPLTGFGWTRFQTDSGPYFQQSQNYPLEQDLTTLSIHNVLLTYAVELGIVGVTLWAFGLLMGVISALRTRGPPDLEPWRAVLVAVTVIFVVVQNSIPPTMFPALSLWMIAGVVYSGRYAGGQPRGVERARPWAGKVLSL